MDFVWVYISRESSYHKCGLFNELEHSIKSVQKFYQGEARCFVVGDDPKLDVIHIPVERFTESHKQPRHMDHMKKLDMLWESDINEEFILMYDDIFILQPTTKEELQITYGKAEVDDPEEYVKTRKGTVPYKRLWLSTYDYIKPFREISGLKTYDWETHLPRFWEKTKLKGIIDKYNLRRVPRIVGSLYAAEHSKETVVLPDDLQADLWTHKPGMDFNVPFAKKYMNIYDNVIIPEFVDKMKEVLDGGTYRPAGKATAG